MADLPTSASFPIEHAQLRIHASAEDGATFVLATEDSGVGRSRPPLFSGLVGPQMADQLRAAADHVDRIIAALAAQDGEGGQ